MKTKHRRAGLILIAALVASCGGDSSTVTPPPVPALAEIAGQWSPVAPAAAAQPAVITGEVVDMIISPDGFVTLVEEIQGLPNFRDFYGQISADLVGYSGTLDFFPIGLNANDDAGDREPTDTVDIRLIFADSNELFGEIVFDDGFVLQFGLMKDAEFANPSLDQDLVGSWSNETSPPFVLIRPLTALTFDDAGNGVGIYEDVCLLETELTALGQRLIPATGGALADGVVQRAEVVATGCEGEGEFSGIAYIRKRDGAPTALQFYLSDASRLVAIQLFPQAAQASF